MSEVRGPIPEGEIGEEKIKAKSEEGEVKEEKIDAKFEEAKTERIIEFDSSLERVFRVSLSPDLKRAIYCGSNNEDERLTIVDGTEVENFEVFHEVLWSPDSMNTMAETSVEMTEEEIEENREALEGVSGLSDEMLESLQEIRVTSALFVNGEEVDRSNVFSNLSFSPDSKRKSWTKIVPDETLPLATLEKPIIDGVKETEVGSQCPFVVFSPDSKDCAYGIIKEDFGGMEEFTEIKHTNIVTSSADARVIRGEKKGKKFLYVKEGVFSPDSNILSYVGYDENTTRIVHMDEEGKETEEEPLDVRIQELSYSPDGENIAHVRDFGDYHSDRTEREEELEQLFVNNEGFGKKYIQIDNLTWSSDNQKIAHRAVVAFDKGLEKVCVVENEVEGREYRKIKNITYSPEGYLNYFASDEKNQVVVIDNVEYPLGPINEVKPLRINFEVDENGLTSEVIVAIQKGNEIVKKNYKRITTEAEKKAISKWAFGESDVDDSTESGIFD